MPQSHYEFYFPSATSIHRDVIDGYVSSLESGRVRKTHLFEGRYENIYIERQEIPGLSVLIDFWLNSAAQVLGLDVEKIQCGFWFNDMQPGDVTLLHSHNDDDELLSGVYYLQVPENSGNLILYHGGEALKIAPESGKLVLFSSSDDHEVSRNLSNKTRLSIGMNFGRRKSPES